MRQHEPLIADCAQEYLYSPINPVLGNRAEPMQLLEGSLKRFTISTSGQPLRGNVIFPKSTQRGTDLASIEVKFASSFAITFCVSERSAAPGIYLSITIERPLSEGE
jgi:hypothetical protein